MRNNRIQEVDWWLGLLGGGLTIVIRSVDPTTTGRWIAVFEFGGKAVVQGGPDAVRGRVVRPAEWRVAQRRIGPAANWRHFVR